MSKRRVTGPRELNASGVCGVVYWEAATVNAPRAEAASGSIASEFVGCSMRDGPRAARDVLQQRRARARDVPDRDAERDAVPPPVPIETNSDGSPVARLFVSAVNAKVGTPPLIEYTSTAKSSVACPQGSAHCSAT